MMKKIIGFSVAILLAICLVLNFSIKSTSSNFGLTISAQRSIANAEINSDCPNGCVWNGSGCYCYDYHRNLREYNW